MALTHFIPTVWSEHLLRALDKKYVGVANCNRVYEGDIKEKGQTVRICGLNDVTVSAYTKNTDMSLPSTLSDNYKDLVINRAMYFNFQIDDIDRAQCDDRLMELALHNATRALADDADAYVYSLYDQATETVTESALTVSNVIGHLIDARTKLLENGVGEGEEVVIEVSPAVAGLILKAKADLCTDNRESLENGCIGSIGGCKIFVSSNIVTTEDPDTGDVTHQCFCRTKRAIAFAGQLSEVEAYRPERRFADAVKGLHLYGAKLVYPKELVVMSFGLGA